MPKCTECQTRNPNPPVSDAQPLQIASPQLSLQNDEWRCGRCTTINKKTVTKCISCKDRNPTAPAESEEDRKARERKEIVDLLIMTGYSKDIAERAAESDKPEQKAMELQRESTQLSADLQFMQDQKNGFIKKFEENKPLSTYEFNIAFMKLKPSDQYGCEVCYIRDDFKLFEIAALDECHHYFCIKCCRTYIETQIENGRSSDMQCIHPDCKRVLKIREITRIYAGAENCKEVLDKYAEFMLVQNLKKDPNVFYCINPNRVKGKGRCENAMIRSSNSPMIACHHCEYTFCCECNVEWHADVTCEKFQEWKKENDNATDLYEIWKKDNTKKCPKCKADIQKNGGCNHMTCSCRHEFCWLCMKKYKSGHYDDPRIECEQFT